MLSINGCNVVSLCMQDCVMGIVSYMTVHKCEYLCCEMYLSGCELSLKVVVVLMW